MYTNVMRKSEMNIITIKMPVHLSRNEKKFEVRIVFKCECSNFMKWGMCSHLIAYNLLVVKPKHILATKAKRAAKKKAHFKASDDDTDSENENQNKDKGRPPNSKKALTRQ